MRKLDRPDPPACLAYYQKKTNPVWNNLNRHHKAEIWHHLMLMQGEFCAYCQCKINPNGNNSHIEHFFQKRGNSKLAFDWSNLFGSCNKPDTCGKHKDKQAKHILPEDICKPDIQDPEGYLQFLRNGEVQPKLGLEQHKQNRAQKTIEAFNLQQSSLVNRRRLAANYETKLAITVFDCIAEYPDESYFQNELESNLKRIINMEFSAVRSAVWNSQ